MGNTNMADRYQDLSAFRQWLLNIPFHQFYKPILHFHRCHCSREELIDEFYDCFVDMLWDCFLWEHSHAARPFNNNL